MNLVQVWLAGILIIKVIIEIWSLYVKKHLKSIRINSQMESYLTKLYSQTAQCNIGTGKYSAYDIKQNQIIIQSQNIEYLDAYCILLHEYGHYKDISAMKKDTRSFIVLVKSFSVICIPILIILMIGAYVLHSERDLLVFFLLLEFILFSIDFIVTIRLEQKANKEALHVVCDQSKHIGMIKQFHYLALILQDIDKFFFSI